MPLYTVNLEYTYVDSFEVEADSPEEAAQIQDRWAQQKLNKAPKDRALDARVIQTAENEYVDYSRTFVHDESGEVVLVDD